MKKIILLVSACLFLFSLTACGGSDTISDDKVPLQEDSVSEGQINNDTENSDSQNMLGVTIDEQVIYDHNDVKVTVKALEYDFWGPGITVLVENDSQQNITVQTRNSSVNGVMIETMFSCDVAAGKKANDSITFYESDLEFAGIETIKDIEFDLHIFDSDEWEIIADSDAILLTTSADESFVQEYNMEGFVAYEDDSYKLIVQKLDSEDSFWGSDLYVYIENNTEENITVQARDVSINGFMVEPSFSCDIVAGKKAYDSITFFESDLEDNGIIDITELEIKFHIFNTDDWETIHDTDAITITFE